MSKNGLAGSRSKKSGIMSVFTPVCSQMSIISGYFACASSGSAIMTSSIGSVSSFFCRTSSVPMIGCIWLCSGACAD
ncbi:hypothetical protein D3C78_1533510 [compost metagenome]